MCVSSGLGLGVEDQWQLINHAERLGIELSVMAFERPISIFNYSVECYESYLLVVEEEALLSLPLMLLDCTKVTVLIYGSENLHLNDYNYVVNSRFSCRVVVSESFCLAQLQYNLVNLCLGSNNVELK